MKSATSFIAYALERANPASVPQGANLPISSERIGTAVGAPWVYLWGTTGDKVTKALLDERWTSYYSKKEGWTRAYYDDITKNWVSEGRYATDCEGLLDSYLGNNVTANYCYNSWCTNKGRIDEISRTWQLGEAVFHESSEKKMTHVGWICGFANGKPIVVESRGLNLMGVVITRLEDRPWTHRGLVTKKLSYGGATDMWLATPEAVKAMQMALNLNGYTDNEGKKLKVDGKWGSRSQYAFDTMCRERGPRPATQHVEVYLDGILKSSFDVYDDGGDDEL